MDGIVKYIQISTFDRSGVPNIELLHPGVMVKTASAHPMIKSAAADLPDREDGIWVLLNAVSAVEYWGSNSNGDAFPEESLKYACDLSFDCPRHLDYGYKTFEKYAFPYRHHANKDPLKSIGERVKLAVWNDEMKRVELIHFLRKDSEFDEFGEAIKVGASDLVTKIESGEEVCVSMGCKVPYDICSICNNKAKNVGLYCDHLKYAMNQTLPDGRQVYAINTLPKFFDISYVLKGAEKTAKVLSKLASNRKQIIASGNETAINITNGMEKAASENRTYILPSAYYADLVKTASGYSKKADDKAAEISKLVPAEGQKIDDSDGLKNLTTSMIHATTPPLPCPVVDRMSEYPVGQIASTMTALGMGLKPQEMARIVALKVRGGAKTADDIGTPRISVDSVNPSIAQLLKNQIEKRSALREPLRRRVLGLLSKSPEEIMDKIAANEEAAQRMAKAGLELSALDKAAPLAALAAALYMMYRKNIKKANLPVFIEKAFGKHPELPAVVIGAGIGGAFGLAGQSMIRGFGHHMEKKAISPLAAKTGLYGTAFAVPYLYSGFVQSKALRGETLGKYEVAAARNPGALAAAGIAGILGRKTIAQKLKGIFSKGMGKKASANIPISDILNYADDGEIVDRAIATGICKVASRLVEFIQPVQGGH